MKSDSAIGIFSIRTLLNGSLYLFIFHSTLIISQNYKSIILLYRTDSRENFIFNTFLTFPGVDTGTSVSIVLKTPYIFELLVLGSKPFHRNDGYFQQSQISNGFCVVE
jgi:hypothetical protein